MYIFGYFFQKGHIQTALLKKEHIDRKLWGKGGREPPLSQPSCFERPEITLAIDQFIQFKQLAKSNRQTPPGLF